MTPSNILLNRPVVPPITDPLGRYWDAPNVDDLTFSLSHVFMTQKQFDRLHNYQHTLPTGTYDGKMWKRKDHRGRWHLMYYYPIADKTKIGIGHFRIQIVKS